MLRVALFERKARGVVLTEPGRRYRDRVAEALDIIEQASADLHKPSADGPLRLSVPMSFAELWLVPRLSRFSDRFQGIELSIEGDSKRANLRRGQADAAIRFGAGAYAGLRVEYLLGDAVTVLAPARMLGNLGETRASQLLSQSVLLDDYETRPDEPWMSWQPWLNEAGLANMPPRRMMRFSNSALTVNACRDSVGLSIGRLSLSFDLLRQSLLVPLFPWRSSEYSYFLLSRWEDQKNPRLEALRAWLVDEIDEYRKQVASDFSFDLPTLQATATG